VVNAVLHFVTSKSPRIDTVRAIESVGTCSAKWRSYLDLRFFQRNVIGSGHSDGGVTSCDRKRGVGETKALKRRKLSKNRPKTGIALTVYTYAPGKVLCANTTATCGNFSLLKAEEN
jgi:hypothetical protein